jgi:type IV pilus assembly protein PilV
MARHRNKSKGFTMVEVLVTTVVTLVALAGLATLQVLSLRAADSSLERTQATTLAAEMVERMRANRDAALKGDYNAKTLCHGDETCSVSTVDCSEDPPTDVVLRDLEALWCGLDQAGMPNWYAAIQGSGEPSLVAVRWDDTRAEAQGSATAADRDSCLGDTIPDGRQEVCVATQL